MRIAGLVLVGIVLLGAGACSGTQPAPGSEGAQSAASEAEFRPNATVRDIMDAMMEFNADYVWDSVETTVSRTGTEEKAPRTDEEWDLVRDHALAMVEATNLLLIPGRHIARAGEKSADPKIELAPEEIEAMVTADRHAWVELVHNLNDVGSKVQKAAEDKSVEDLLSAGADLEMACEKCHLKYWYPGEANNQ